MVDDIVVLTLVVVFADALPVMILMHSGCIIAKILVIDQGATYITRYLWLPQTLAANFATARAALPLTCISHLIRNIDGETSICECLARCRIANGV